MGCCSCGSPGKDKVPNSEKIWMGSCHVDISFLTQRLTSIIKIKDVTEKENNCIKLSFQLWIIRYHLISHGLWKIKTKAICWLTNNFCRHYSLTKLSKNLSGSSCGIGKLQVLYSCKICPPGTLSKEEVSSYVPWNSCKTCIWNLFTIVLVTVTKYDDKYMNKAWGYIGWNIVCTLVWIIMIHVFSFLSYKIIKYFKLPGSLNLNLELLFIFHMKSGTIHIWYDKNYKRYSYVYIFLNDYCKHIFLIYQTKWINPEKERKKKKKTTKIFTWSSSGRIRTNSAHLAVKHEHFTP